MKVTVIATGFQPAGMPVPVKPVTVESRLLARPEPTPERAPEMEPTPDPQPEPEPAIMAAEPVYDPDDLDTPAYLRQGRLIN